MKKNTINENINKLRVFLKDYFLQNSYPPTVREICDYMGFKSTSSAHKYLRILSDIGDISINSNISRGIRLENKLLGISEFYYVPLVGEITAGQPIFAEESYSAYFSIPKSLFGFNNTFFMLKVSGSSMIDVGINDGDFILINKQSYATNRDIIAALIDDEYATVKRYFLENNRVRLHPENRNMSDFYPENIKILGVVKGLIRTEVK
ncbi:MAG: transcriptional repressor LexA [Christensenellales bacterium]|jgi:repressor LexA